MNNEHKEMELTNMELWTIVMVLATFLGSMGFAAVYAIKWTLGLT